MRRTATTAAAVLEVLPLIGNPLGEAFVCVSFPLFGALIAAAASISKARCVVFPVNYQSIKSGMLFSDRIFLNSSAHDVQKLSIISDFV